MTTVNRFFGINNITDPLRLGVDWMTVAKNVHVTDTGSLVRRDGYTRASTGSFTDLYSTADFSRMYVVNSGVLKSSNGTVHESIQTLESADRMHWCEINNQVFYNNGTDNGILNRDHGRIDWKWDIPAAPVLQAVTGLLAPGLYCVLVTTRLSDGRETGTSDLVELVIEEGQALQISGIPTNSNVYISPANSTVFSLAGSPTGSALVWNFSPDLLGRDLVFKGLDPLPTCDVIQAWKGRIYASQYARGQSVVWFSQALGFHLFDLAKDFFMVPGKVTMLAPHDAGLIVGTEDEIYAYTPEGLAMLADYGVVPGQHWSTDDKRILFWTTRGVCSALPFTNLTERSVSVAPGVAAGGTIVRQGGQKRYLVVLQQGGTAFNVF